MPAIFLSYWFISFFCVIPNKFVLLIAFVDEVLELYPVSALCSDRIQLDWSS
jgi:hypothetical protein